MTPSDTLRPQMERVQRSALFVGLLALVISLAGLFMDPAHFWQSYLFAFIFWSGLALGCLGVFFLHNVVGGNWGVAIRRLVESGVQTLPLILVFAIPLFFALGTLYKWTDAGYRAEHFATGHKAAYLNPTWFIIRTLLYFAIWLFSGLRILKMANEHDRTGDPALFRRIKARSAPALLVFVLTTTLAFIDWIMSLEPDWYSTIYGWMFTVGEVLLTFSFLVAVLVLLSKREPFASFLTRQHYHDIGNLMLAFTMLWAYMSFSQFLIIWAENLPDEIPWYVRRFSGGWGYIAWTIAIFHFFVPFFLLLLRFVKKNPARLRTLAVWIILMHILDVFWIVGPAFRQRGLEVYWTDLVALIGLGGVWLAFFIRNLKARPLLASRDPRDTYSLLVTSHGHGH
ncbi:MAG TPA: hypothetical protein VK686_25285 [Bryobacteraceae bacterium]|nr:hypothetical protein [Bryobacteraceae bacterium]